MKHRLEFTLISYNINYIYFIRQLQDGPAETPKKYELMIHSWDHQRAVEK